MSGMKVSLPGMFASIRHELVTGGSAWADFYSFSLVELEKHLRETIRGEHTLKEFAEHYCLIDAAPPAMEAAAPVHAAMANSSVLGPFLVGQE